MSKLANFWRVLQIGQTVANPAAWKKGQIGASAIVALLVALTKLADSFGYTLPASPEQIDALGVGLFALVNIVLTVSTTKTVGLRSKRNPAVEEPAADAGKPVSRWNDDETQL